MGFLSDPRRLNVALTRAKYGLVILGNPKVLAKNELWSVLLSHCKDEGCLVEGPLTSLRKSAIQLPKSKKVSILISYRPICISIYQTLVKASVLHVKSHSTDFLYICRGSWKMVRSLPSSCEWYSADDCEIYSTRFCQSMELRIVLLNLKTWSPCLDLPLKARHAVSWQESQTFHAHDSHRKV